MSEELLFTKGSDRESLYREIIPQIEALVNDEASLIANMANVSAVIKEVFGRLWVGFYLLDKKQNNLVLGPFQGPLACTRIEFGKGVCGSAYQKKEVIIVPDVDQFPGHIACSSLSKSEIVIPGILNKEVIFVLDIDSKDLNEFDEMDKLYLEKIVGIIINQESRQ